jgi:hypothetical protein
MPGKQGFTVTAIDLCEGLISAVVPTAAATLPRELGSSF